MRKLVTILVFMVMSLSVTLAQDVVKRFSTAGFYELSGTPRAVVSMNPAWRFAKGAYPDAAKVEFNDKDWEVVSLPNGMELLPLEASGGVNYRGESWYRKHFTLDESYQDKRIVLYFEGVMGKSKIWVNGELVRENFSGFMPIGIDITRYAKVGDENLIAVMADNSDDPDFPPGKPQATLDFCYFGGIYRDCWLYTTSKSYITDENMADMVAGGGLRVNYTQVGDESATVNLELNLQNENAKTASGVIEFELMDKTGAKITAKTLRYNMAAMTGNTFSSSIVVTKPELWSPDSPYQYCLNIRVKDNKGAVVDGYMRKIGIRSIAFSHEQGFILNGKPFPRKLIGANRHQDFAVIGNALSNNIHWRDAQKLKNAGMDVIRNAHYPQDPAFMDACDELGLFVIENTPGWQFWNAKPIFEQRVYTDIRNMVRRDRNRPSIIMWEPILNETWYPEPFAANVHNVVKQEFPFEPNYTACDLEARGRDNFDVIFTHPANGEGGGYGAGDHVDKNKVYFTREFGDNVDDWNSHNSPSRVARQWGEIPMIIQAQHYAKPPYTYTSIDALFRTPKYHFGGTLWHSFDHQRGYHPDPFYGGVMSSFRRPKYSYYMFQAQSDKVAPMVFIANEMTPFSPQDVTVYSNCDEVRLYTQVGDTVRTYHRPANDRMTQGMPSPVITFEKAFDVMMDKKLARDNKHAKSFLYAEGLIDGKVVATHRVTPSRRPTQVKLLIDTDQAAPVADGGDQVTIVAQIADANGVLKRLNNMWIHFEIEGEGTLVGDNVIHQNPQPVLWGEAPILVQTTTKPGKVRVKASVQFEGENKPTSTILEFETKAPAVPLLYSAAEAKSLGKIKSKLSTSSVDAARRAEIDAALKEVEQQQEAFGEKKK